MIKIEYSRLNSSFKKKLVYHLGSEAGFFSEYNNMILAMLYCLKHKIKFILYSKDANFGYEKGWQDYFLPFCEESADIRQSKYNPRQPIENLSVKKNIKTIWFRFITGTDHLTFNLWKNFHNKNFESEQFDIPELNLKCNVIEAARQLIDLTWNYNELTDLDVKKLILNLQLPQNYIGMHVRGGDKFLEYEKIELDSYFKIVIQKSELRDVFVLTDDYRVIIELQQRYTNYTFYTLCDKNENGYYHDDFFKSNLVFKKYKLLNLFASIDVLSSADYFVGTFSSNPGMYLGMRMPKNKVFGVDLEKWTIW